VQTPITGGDKKPATSSIRYHIEAVAYSLAVEILPAKHQPANLQV
jgi:hypothetical protein